MRVAIVTMVYNERVNLPIWLRHYTSHCPGAVLFVIDHGSDDGSTRGLPSANLIPLPRTPFDDQTRVEMVADLQHGLLRFYDVVIYTDCDEMLVADPRIHTSLAGFLAATASDVIAPIGLNLHHLIGSEPAIDLRAPILGQRGYVRFASSMCKPAIARVPIRWAAGFHWCDRVPDYRSDLFQFHLRWMDMSASLARLQLTRTMEWSERALRSNWGPRQRQSDEERIREEFEEPTRQVALQGVAPFEFDAQMARVVDSLRLQDQLYRVDAFRGPIARVPETFAALI
jgi:Glycosyl transferase family 2